jgi:hypothetical protein
MAKFRRASGSLYADTLFIEYQHLHILLNSIGMQRIIQRVLSEDEVSSPASPASLTGSTIDACFIERARRLNMTTREFAFIEEVIDGCCLTLERVTALGEGLQYVPMRIVYRMISSCIFLMKALALGVRNGKLQESIQILDRAISALQNNSQDDAHLKVRYAAFLKSQVLRLQKSFMSSYSVNASDNHLSTQAYGDMTSMLDGGFSEIPMDSWLSLPFDPSMAPFGLPEGDFDGVLNGMGLELDFLGQFSQ